MHAYSLFLLPLSLLSIALYSPHLSFLCYFLTVNLMPPKLPLSLLKPLYCISFFNAPVSSSLLYPHVYFSFPPSPFFVSSVASLPSTPLVLNFYLDSRWGLHADRLVVSKEQRCARSVPGLSLLQAADHALTSCHLTSDLLVGDVAITQGRHYWACSVEPGSYLVKVTY